MKQIEKTIVSWMALISIISIVISVSTMIHEIFIYVGLPLMLVAALWVIIRA